MLFSCRRLVRVLICSLVFAFSPLFLPVSFAQQMGDAAFFSWNANLNAPLGSKIIWAQDVVPVQEKDLYQEASLSGRLPPNSQSLRLNGKLVPLRADMGFDLLLGFQGPEKVFTLEYLNDENHLITETFSLSLDQAGGKRFRRVSKAAPRPKTFITLGAGYTLLHYEQTHITPFDERVLSVKAAYQTFLPGKHWDFGISSFYNAAILQSTTLKHTIRFLGVNGKFGYQFLPDNRSVQFALQAGAYYNTSFGDVGFSNVFGPQLFPVVTFLVNKESAVRVYAKFSPVKSAGSSFNPSKDREIATGISYSTFFGKQAVFFAFDYSKLDLNEEPVSANLSTSTLSVGLGF